MFSCGQDGSTLDVEYDDEPVILRVNLESLHRSETGVKSELQSMEEPTTGSGEV